MCACGTGLHPQGVGVTAPADVMTDVAMTALTKSESAGSALDEFAVGFADSTRTMQVAERRQHCLRTLCTCQW